MTYLEYFDPASERDEAEYVLSFNYKVEMTCFAESVYPFKIFPEKYFSHAEFAPITVFLRRKRLGKIDISQYRGGKTGTYPQGTNQPHAVF